MKKPTTDNKRSKPKADAERSSARVWLTEVVAGDYLDAEYNYNGPDWTYRDGYYYHPRIVGKRTEADAVALQLNWMQPGYAEMMAASHKRFMEWVAERPYVPPPERKRKDVAFYDPEARDDVSLDPPPEDVF